MSNIEKLLIEATALKGLLEDPHPGLSTWQSAYQARVDAISEYSTGKD